MSIKNIQIKNITDSGDVFIDMADDPMNPCKSCGVCCTHFRVSFYNGELDSNGGTVPNNLVTQITPFLVAMKGTENGGRCTSLIGEIGKDISCGIYHNRSSSCRAFPVWLEDGSPNEKCQELRVKNGLPKLLNVVPLG
jgi:hypothetical protein